MRSFPVIVLAFLIAASAAAVGAPENGAAQKSAAPAQPATPPAREAPPPPPPPESYQPAPTPGTPEPGLEPEITITTKGTEIHAEYRLSGRLYMIKVTPAKGKPYYLIDYEGSGQFRRSDLEPNIMIPTWVIKRF